MIVELVGTALLAPVDANGHFELKGVPSGDWQLRFVGNGADARVEIGAVRSDETITITVTVSGTRAAVISLQRMGADETQLVGAIDGIDAGARRLSVSGRAVQVTATTVIQRNGQPATFETFRIGDRLEVRGRLEGAVLVAGRIEVQRAAEPAPAPAPAEVEFTGLITALDPTARSLVVAGRRVLTNGATLIRRRGDPVGFDALRVNQRVEVKGVTQPDGAILASRITIEDEAPQLEVEFTGLVTALDPAARSLVVAGRRVLTNGATLIRRRGDPVGFDALRVNQRVEVKGVAQPDGAVLASRITIEDEAPQLEVEFTGLITALDPAARSLVVAGRRVLTNGATLIRRRGDPVGFDALRVNQRVEVKGVAQPDGAVLASRITIEDEAPQLEVEFTGLITALDPAARSLVVAGRRVLTTGATLIRRRGDPVGFDALRVNQRVEVKGVAQPDGAVLASRITIED